MDKIDIKSDKVFCPLRSGLVILNGRLNQQVPSIISSACINKEGESQCIFSSDDKCLVRSFLEKAVIEKEVLEVN